jgi:fido (protein-threonine AMPylation protein)
VIAVAGAFDASTEFEEDPLVTADEILVSGGRTFSVLEQVARSSEPWVVDIKLIKEIHFRWFETTFPADAGEFRTQMVLNRKSTAVEVEAILPAIDSACGNWNWRREHQTPTNGADLMQFAVAEANTLTVRVYDVHPFIDGNTRAAWHLRNYLLMLDGLPPLDNLVDRQRYTTAWWTATAEDHDDLDEAVLAEINAQIDAEASP